MQTPVDEPLYLIRVISNKCYQKLLQMPEKERVLTSTLGYNPKIEFPGVCTTLVTKDNLAWVYKEMYPGDIVLFLSVRLLQQHNWHFNKDDNWGCLNEDTVWPWQFDAHMQQRGVLQTALNIDSVGNEVVFHDPIPYRFVLRVLSTRVRPTSWPRTRLVADDASTDEPELTLLPFYCHFNWKNHPYSDRLVKAIASLVVGHAQVLTMTKSECYNVIYDNTDMLYTNRHLQRLNDMQFILLKLDLDGQRKSGLSDVIG